MKKVSVVVPAYNAAKYLAKTLHSIHLQTVQPYEVVVVNDCSTDDTAMIAEACGKLYFHKIEFNLLQHKQNRGIGATRLDGALAAKGDYVAFLSSDDLYEPDFLIYSLLKLDQDHATFTDYYRVNEELQLIDIFKAPYYKTFEEFRILAINWALRKNMFVNFSSVILPKWIFEEAKFLLKLRHGEDLVFLLDTIIAGLRWNHIRKPLTKYRIHQKQGTVLLDPQEWLLTWKMAADRLLKLGVPEQEVILAMAKSKNLYMKRQTPFRTAVRKVFAKVKATALRK